MKKTFPLKAPGKDDARVVEAIKNEVRKYVKRERRKTLPEGFSVWEFNCRVGPDSATAESLHLDQISGAIDAVVQGGGGVVYVEVLAAAGHRKQIPRVVVAAPDA